MMAEEKDPTVIVAQFQITRSLPNQSQLVISGHFYNKDDPKEINARLDDWMTRANRQFHIASLEKLESDRKMSVDNLARIRDIYEKMKEKVQQGKKLKTQELQQYNQGEASIKAALQGIQYIEDGISEIKRKAGIT